MTVYKKIVFRTLRSRICDIDSLAEQGRMFAKSPPWDLAPEMDPDDPDSHGAGEAFILVDWLRFWQLLRQEQQEAYLDQWNASRAWRRAIRERYDHYPFEIDRDLLCAMYDTPDDDAAPRP